jgi:hypothetical protein
VLLEALGDGVLSGALRVVALGEELGRAGRTTGLGTGRQGTRHQTYVITIVLYLFEFRTGGTSAARDFALVDPLGVKADVRLVVIVQITISVTRSG